MNTKRLVIGTVVGTVILYLLGYLIWEQAFADFFAAERSMREGLTKDPSVLWASVAGSVSYALLLVLAIGSRGSSVSIVDGVKVGATVGFLLWFTADIIIFSYLDISTLTGAIADSVLEGVRGAITGAAVVAVLAKVGD